jgi:hypothetical protein
MLQGYGVADRKRLGRGLILLMGKGQEEVLYDATVGKVKEDV